MKFQASQVAKTKEIVAAVEPLSVYLKQNPLARVSLVGHGDANLTRGDYAAVGNVRAISVKRSLIDLGVDPSRMTIDAPEMQPEKFEAAKVHAGGVEIRVLAPGKEKGPNVH